MFSVIIPLYNKAAYIEKAIRSVAAQTFREFELIIIDDGSTDDPIPPKGGTMAERLRNVNAPIQNIRIIDQENSGVSTARNNGVKAAKYEYIAFLDADDWWEPTYLEEMKGLIEEFPEAGIYGSSYYKVKNAKFIPARIGVEEGFERGLINYCRVYSKTLYQPIWTGATIIKKEVFESENGFKPTLKLGEDFDLWVRVGLTYPVAFVNKPLAYYNQDVDLNNRAIGIKLYEPEQHMLFSDYGRIYQDNDFRHLFEALAVYGLLPYYLTRKNEKQVNSILSGIHWKEHSFKYRLYYIILPKVAVKYWFDLLRFASKLKGVIIRKRIQLKNR